MTDPVSRLGEIRERLARATPGPWTSEMVPEGGANVRQQPSNGYQVAVNTDGEYGGGACSVIDDVGWLLEHIEQLQQQADEFDADRIELVRELSNAEHAAGEAMHQRDEARAQRQAVIRMARAAFEAGDEALMTSGEYGRAEAFGDVLEALEVGGDR